MYRFRWYTHMAWRYVQYLQYCRAGGGTHSQRWQVPKVRDEYEIRSKNARYRRAAKVQSGLITSHKFSTTLKTSFLTIDLVSQSRTNTGGVTYSGSTADTHTHTRVILPLYLC